MQVPEPHSSSELHSSNKQKQPSRGVLVKRCSENMQQIYRCSSPFNNRLNRRTNILHILFWYILHNYLVVISVDNLQS